MRLINHIRKSHKSINISKDIFSGIIVALVSIPIAMGYAQIAGLPAVYGLYGSLLPILVFGFFTTSPQFVVGVDAMPAAMVGGLLTQMGFALESKETMEVVPFVSFLVMCWFIVFFFFKAGRIVKYISKPVMGGFISGVGITIILMQIPKLFGGSTGTGEIIVLIRHIIHEIPKFNLLSFALGLGTVIIILVFKKLVPKLPMTVIMLVAGAALQAIFHLDRYGVKLLPEVASGLPRIVLPKFDYLFENHTLLLLESFSIAAVIMAQTLLATGNYALKYGDKIDNNAELLAYAAMNGASALVGCCPVNGSVSRSGIADSFGCRSQIMSFVSAVTMLLVILFGTPLLKFLPVPILTGIVMTALIGILEISLCIRLFKTSKREWAIFMVSLLAVLVFGTVNGVLIGCALSFADVAISAATPPTAFLGRIPGQGNYYALERNTAARPIKNAVIYRFSGNLIFANIDRFQSDIENAIEDDTKVIVVDGRGISNIDITAVDRLVILSDSLARRNIKFYLTEHGGELNDQIRLLGGNKLVESGKVRRTITLALRDAGFEKPYELTDNSSLLDNNPDEPDEMLAEFEWVFGKEAEERLTRLADKTAEAIAKEVHDGVEVADIINSERVQTSWGKLGRFDENEFWDHLEMRLEELSHSGKITLDELNRIEKKIEERRIRGEKRLREISPHALTLLRKHREKLLEHLSKSKPKEYEHMMSQQEKVFEEIKETGSSIDSDIMKLHDAKNNDKV